MEKIFITLALSAFSLMSFGVNAANEVSLSRATSSTSYYHGFSWHDGRFEVQLSNISAAKLVFVHMKTSTGSWVDFPLSYAYSSGSNKEVWGASFFNGTWAGSTNTLPETGDVIEFSIKYQANGQTYWDNNQGANYRMARGAGTMLGAGKNISAADYAANITVSQTNIWNGHITVRNLAYAKDVKLLYTTDHWLTSKTVSASFVPYWAVGYSNVPNPNTLGFEEWIFQANIGAAAQVEYAVSYTVNGNTYWDNNFGRNYVSNITHGN